MERFVNICLKTVLQKFTSKLLELLCSSVFCAVRHIIVAVAMPSASDHSNLVYFLELPSSLTFIISSSIGTVLTFQFVLCVSISINLAHLWCYQLQCNVTQTNGTAVRGAVFNPFFCNFRYSPPLLHAEYPGR